MSRLRIATCAALIAVGVPTAAHADLSPAQCQALQRPMTDFSARMGDLWGDPMRSTYPHSSSRLPPGLRRQQQSSGSRLRGLSLFPRFRGLHKRQPNWASI